MDLTPHTLARRAAYGLNRLGVTPIDAHTELLNRVRRVGDRDGAKALRRAVAGRVVLVTGASSGIGRATAIQLGAAGAVVILVARREELLWEVSEEIAASGGHGFVHACDLLDLDAIDTLVKRVLTEHGRVDILLNCAGMSIRRKVQYSSERFRDFERPMALNYYAAVRLTTGLLPAMSAQGSGQVVNISSWATQVRPARFSGYTASKAALEAWSDCVQAEVLDEGIVFTTVRLPLVRTPMIAPTKSYNRIPALTAEQAAAAVCGAIARRARRVSPLVASVVTLTELVSPRTVDRIRKHAI